jgi:hypothetical protein
MSDLANVNFQILVKMHNGDVGRAEAAWKKICQLGRYGNVPPSYQGGLDVKGLKNGLEDVKSGHFAYEVETYAPGQNAHTQFAPTLEDDIKRIEDLAAGDNPKGSWRDTVYDTPVKGDWK